MTEAKRPEFYTPTFAKNRKRYGNLSKRIASRVDDILADPFAGTEALVYKAGIERKAGKALPLLPRSLQ